MSGRRGASRRMRRRQERRKLRVRRLAASSSAAMIAVAGLGTLDLLSFPAVSDGTNEAAGGQLAAAAANPVGAESRLLTEDSPGRLDSSPLSRAAHRDSPHRTVEVTLDTGPDYKPPATAPLPADSGSGKRVVFDVAQQRVWLVAADGSVERTYLVSGSRYDQLEPGTYEVFSASRHAVSWTGSETMEYMVRFHRGRNSNIGFHDIPVRSATGKEVQTVSELGTPLSDGCIRQDHEDAKALYDFAPVGTTVVVVRT